MEGKTDFTRAYLSRDPAAGRRILSNIIYIDNDHGASGAMPFSAEGTHFRRRKSLLAEGIASGEGIRFQQREFGSRDIGGPDLGASVRISISGRAS